MTVLVCVSVPAAAPEFSAGSFRSIDVGDNKREVTVYWQVHIDAYLYLQINNINLK